MYVLLQLYNGETIEQNDLLNAIKNSKPELDKEMLDQFDEDKKRLIES